MPNAAGENRYQAIIEKIFFDHYFEGASELPFNREEILSAAHTLKIELTKNPGDVVYSFRYRRPLPERILSTQPEGMEWIIEGVGRARYVFRLVKLNRIQPRQELVTRKIPDATPEIISAYALNDEQALLAIVRYNRLIDIFLGLTTYSLQNHLRTTLRHGSQIEIDEIYIGLDRQGHHYVIPVQAKGGNDQISVVQTRQDIQCCAEKFEGIVCRAVSAQFMDGNRIALFELAVESDEVKVVDERHYILVPASEINDKKTIS
ncbi:endonuclease [Ferruginivarius sediminum]|uniref:Endonuclease n=1 Tax=Ferruginivarius sediminum TaxID=2661937 RepID=A0A369T4G1_9PROT|nr:endonuclease [Ferruginivarius sediminum]RDD60209.1 endonuclease [Ferruginivarius sediminum]